MLKELHNGIFLRKLKETDETKFLAYCQGWNHESLVVPSAANLNGKSFHSYMSLLSLCEQGQYCPKTHVATKTYVLVDQNDIFYGMLNLRLSLNEHLFNYDGHIGYGIHPKYRNKGLGKMILKLGLEKAKKHGIMDVLITCNEENIASKKVIESAGGILENKIFKTDGYILRYWIHIHNTCI